MSSITLSYTTLIFKKSNNWQGDPSAQAPSPEVLEGHHLCQRIPKPHGCFEAGDCVRMRAGPVHGHGEYS